MNQNKLRSEVYLLLAETYKEPTAQFAAEQPALAGFLQQAFRDLKYDIPPGLYENWPSLATDLPSLANQYRQSFIYPVQTRIIPVESVYRQWTSDTTAELPFATDKGLLMSDHALHMNSLYNAYGITIPQAYHSLPDHICLELEFAALLLELNETDRYFIFIRVHLNWLDELAADAEQQAIPEFYRQVIKLTAQFLALELRREGNAIF